MPFGISTRCFGARPVTLDMLETLRKGGFDRIEIHANRPAIDFHSRSTLRDIARWFGENALPPPSLHLPFEELLDRGEPRPLSVVDPDILPRQAAIDEMKRCLEIAERLQIDYVVLHAGVPGQKYHPVAFDHLYAAIKTIQSFAGVRVLIENGANGISSIERIAEFKTAAQLDDLGICYDAGHADAGDSGIPDASVLKAIHLNDNNGRDDEHLWPFEGKREWPKFVETLAGSSFDGPLILESASENLAKAGECRSRLTDLLHEARHSIEEFRLKYNLTAATLEADQ